MTIPMKPEVGRYEEAKQTRNARIKLNQIAYTVFLVKHTSTIEYSRNETADESVMRVAIFLGSLRGGKISHFARAGTGGGRLLGAFGQRACDAHISDAAAPPCRAQTPPLRALVRFVSPRLNGIHLQTHTCCTHTCMRRQKLTHTHTLTCCYG